MILEHIRIHNIFLFLLYIAIMETKQFARRKRDPVWDRIQQESMSRRSEIVRQQVEIDKLKDDVYSEFDLMIIYSIEYTDHDGYCSDPENITVLHRTCREIVGLPKLFKKRDFVVDGYFTHTIDINNVELQRLFSKQSSMCERGSGCCGCITKYSIHSATIRVKKHFVNLDDPISVNDFHF